MVIKGLIGFFLGGGAGLPQLICVMES